MRNIHKIDKYENGNTLAGSLKPRGIHHTVSYAESFNDTWSHIKNELRKTYKQVHS